MVTSAGIEQRTTTLSQTNTDVVGTLLFLSETPSVSKMPEIKM